MIIPVTTLCQDTSDTKSIPNPAVYRTFVPSWYDHIFFKLRDRGQVKHKHDMLPHYTSTLCVFSSTIRDCTKTNNEKGKQDFGILMGKLGDINLIRK